MINNINAPRIPTERKWYACPYCGQKLVIVNNVAHSAGVYVRCKRCRNEVEIKV